MFLLDKEVPVTEKILVIFFFIIGSVGMMMCVSGVGLFGYQLYVYLHDGFWMPVSTIDGFLSTLNWFSPISESTFKLWLIKPNIWIGVHKVLTFIPMSIFLFIFPLMLFILFVLVFP